MFVCSITHNVTFLVIVNVTFLVGMFIALVSFLSTVAYAFGYM